MDQAAYTQFRELERDHWWFRGRRAIFFDVLDRALRGRAAVRTLDLGCGMGGMLGPLARYGPAFGTDVSEEGLSFCRGRGFTRVARADGYHLPFRDGTFDLVTLFDTVEHIPEDERVFAEAARVLRPGGLLMITGPAYGFLYSDNDAFAQHCRRYTMGDLCRKTARAGFRPVERSYVNFFLFPVILPLVLIKSLLYRLRRPSAEQLRSNISYRMPGPLNAALSGIFGAERFVLRRMSVPVGHSLFLLARKA